MQFIELHLLLIISEYLAVIQVRFDYAEACPQGTEQEPAPRGAVQPQAGQDLPEHQGQTWHRTGTPALLASPAPSSYANSKEEKHIEFFFISIPPH